MATAARNLESEGAVCHVVSDLKTALALIVQLKPETVVLELDAQASDRTEFARLTVSDLGVKCLGVVSGAIENLPDVKGLKFIATSQLTTEALVAEIKASQKNSQNLLAGALAEVASTSEEQLTATEDSSMGLRTPAKAWSQTKRYGGEKLVIKQRQKIEHGSISVELVKAQDVAKKLRLGDLSQADFDSAAEQVDTKRSQEMVKAPETLPSSMAVTTEGTNINHVTGQIETKRSFQHISGGEQIKNGLQHASGGGGESTNLEHVSGKADRPGSMKHVGGKIESVKPLEHVGGKVEPSTPVEHVQGLTQQTTPGKHVSGLTMTKQETSHVTGVSYSRKKASHVQGEPQEKAALAHVDGQAFSKPKLQLVAEDAVSAIQFDIRLFSVVTESHKYICFIAFDSQWEEPAREEDMRVCLEAYLRAIGKASPDGKTSIQLENPADVPWVTEFQIFFMKVIKDPKEWTMACLSETEKIMHEVTVVKGSMRRISVRDVPANCPLPTAIYVHLPKNDRYIMYARENGQLSQAQIDHLHAHTPDVFVDADRFEEFKKFVVETSISISIRAFPRRRAG